MEWGGVGGFGVQKPWEKKGKTLEKELFFCFLLLFLLKKQTHDKSLWKFEFFLIGSIER